MPPDILFALICSVLFGGAAALQKRAIDANVAEGWGKVAKSRRWLTGVLMELVGDGLYLLAVLMPGARLVVIQPIVASHFVFAMAFGVFLLRELLGVRDRVAAGLLLAGGGIVALGGAMDRPEADGAMSDGFALRLAFAALLAGVLIARRVLARWRTPRTREVMFAILSGLSFSMSVVASKIASFQYRQQFGWPPVREVFGWAFTTAAPWLMVFGNVLGFILLQVALRHGRVSMVSPIVGLVSMIMPMAISVAALGEHLSGATGAGAALVVGGLVVLLSGAAGEDVKEGVA